MQPPQQPPFPGQPQQPGRPQQPGWPNQPQQPGWQSPQYGGPQYGGPQLGAPQQPPRRNRQAAYWSLGAVGVVLVVALIIVLAVQPWKKSGGGVQTFELDRAITVEVRTPSGWTAKEMSAEGASAVLILPAGDDRGYDEINTDFKSLRNGRSGKPIHAVVINAGSCSSDAASSWDTGDVDKGTVGEATRLGRRAVWNVRGSDCARMISTDMDSGRPASTASELLVSLAGSGAVVPRHDGTRPSIRPSS